ncbi:hypothetical protein BDZ91DRAFT_723101 [Kalaharituber pfeilii]|nr:hypothetical protein BDZ91DRAFT_723101 [Kalaharituber pfeilii]
MINRLLYFCVIHMLFLEFKHLPCASVRFALCLMIAIGPTFHRCLGYGTAGRLVRPEMAQLCTVSQCFIILLILHIKWEGVHVGQSIHKRRR